jgi:hypothetical protein
LRGRGCQWPVADLAVGVGIELVCFGTGTRLGMRKSYIVIVVVIVV